MLVKALKYTWPHLLFWGVFIFVLSARSLVYHPHYFDLAKTNFFFSLFYAPFLYLSFYYLIPRLLLNREILLYIFLTVGGLMLTTFIATSGSNWIYNTLYGMPEFGKWMISPEGRLICFSEILMLLGFVMALFFMQKWYQKDRYAKELEKQNLEAELSMLKSQVNPHFVFNTLNTIYHLVEQDKSKAQQVLVQFSDSLSHQLYDTDKDRIPLYKEIAYLGNYVAIQKVRSGDRLDLQVQWPELDPALQVAPMLLMPLVENAFKHGNTAATYRVHISLNLTGKTMHFKTSNSYKSIENNDVHGGIGLTNLRRRLELIYPGKHDLQLNKEAGNFDAHLTLELEKSVDVSGHQNE